jgi:hypothetical protein
MAMSNSGVQSGTGSTSPVDFGSLANSIGLGNINWSQLGSLLGLNQAGQMAFGMTAPSSLTSLLNNPSKATASPSLASSATQPASSNTGAPWTQPGFAGNPGAMVDPATGHTYTVPGTDIPWDPAVQVTGPSIDSNIPAGRD